MFEIFQVFNFELMDKIILEFDYFFLMISIRIMSSI